MQKAEAYGLSASGVSFDFAKVVERLLEEIQPNQSSVLADGKLPKVVAQG